MSLWSSIESFFSKVPAELETVTAGAATLNNYIGGVLGQAETVVSAASIFDPALGAMVSGGIAAVSEINSLIGEALAAPSPNATKVAGQIASATTQAVNLAVLVAPFYDVTAKLAAAVDTTAVTAAKSVASVAAFA
jgi:hypothetical protein